MMENQDYTHLTGCVPIPKGSSVEISHTNSNGVRSTMILFCDEDTEADIIYGRVVLKGDFELVDLVKES